MDYRGKDVNTSNQGFCDIFVILIRGVNTQQSSPQLYFSFIIFKEGGENKYSPPPLLCYAVGDELVWQVMMWQVMTRTWNPPALCWWLTPITQPPRPSFCFDILLCCILDLCFCGDFGDSERNSWPDLGKFSLDSGGNGKRDFFFYPPRRKYYVHPFWKAKGQLHWCYFKRIVN